MVKADHLEDLVRLGTLSRNAARFLAASVVAGLNILVAGGTQAGKTTMLNCLSSAIPSRERVVTCEEVFELKIPLRDVASMQCRQPSLEGTGEIPLRRLVKEALRMRPSRIIVGEVRQAESLDLLIALNSGLPLSVEAQWRHDRKASSDLLPDLTGPYRRRTRRSTARARLSHLVRAQRLGGRAGPRGQRRECLVRQTPTSIRAFARSH